MSARLCASNNYLQSIILSARLRSQPALNYESRRNAARNRKWLSWPNDWLPFVWTRPEKKAGYVVTGDREHGIPPYDPATLKLHYDVSKELQNAPEIVRRQFTLEYAKNVRVSHIYLLPNFLIESIID